jgi:hypothetical protein
MMLSKKYSIRRHIAWLTMTPLLVMVISMEAFFLNDRANSMDQDLITRGRLIASQLAASSEYGVFSDNHTFLGGIAESAMQQEDVRSVYILNDVKIMAQAGTLPKALGALDIQANRKVAYSSKTETKLTPKRLLDLVNEHTTLLNRGDTALLYQPILSTQIPLSDLEAAPSASRIGAVIIEMSWLNTRQLQNRMLWMSITATALFLLLTLFIIYPSAS